MIPARVYIDADGIVYAAAFAAQRTRYHVGIFEDGQVIETAVCSNQTEVKALAASLPPGQTVQCEPEIDADPEDKAGLNVHTTMRSIMDEVAKVFPEHESPACYLTHGQNFRHNVATVRPYKGHRKPEDRPVHYNYVRQVFVDRFGATSVTGIEADDMVAMGAYKCRTLGIPYCIVSADKDLLTVPGHAYNFRSGAWTHSTEDEARCAFYRQMLTGDTVDNIVGVFKCGPAAAEKLIRPDMDEAAMARTVLQQIELSQKKKGCPYSNMHPASYMLELGRLLHMLRFPEDVWRIPDGV